MKNYIIPILVIALLLFGGVIYHLNNKVIDLKADLSQEKQTFDTRLRKELNDVKQSAIDSMQLALDNRPMPKKPDTVFINTIKYEKSKNSILDSSSLYQYNWSKRKLDSIYAK